MLNELSKVLCDINGHGLADGCVLAASPLFKQPHTNPYRIVLRLWNEQFVVHMQMWFEHTTPDLLVPDIHTGSFSEGDYFPLHRFAEAMARWCVRCQRQVEYASTIYREIHAA